ncbi:unnamed protein product [Trifolium pratense]|uniref:Uncharacterized protein n=1 Tax=Trifolium pratense TaxID=57577 RepID=A0ACB0K341_TRIPR|nr:unnamed protein product [Trifolium pratense]
MFMCFKLLIEIPLNIECSYLCAQEDKNKVNLQLIAGPSEMQLKNKLLLSPIYATMEN